MMKKKSVEVIQPKSFEPQKHYYEKVLNAQIHPLIAYFLNMSKESLIKRYCHLHPQVDANHLSKLINYAPRYLLWSGADYIYSTTSEGKRTMVLLEMNSSPSGQKSMPLLNEDSEQGGYKLLIEESFLPEIKRRDLPKGKLAVIYDKNYMEASGYAAALAESTGEEVILAPYYNSESKAHIYFDDGILTIKVGKKKIKIRASLRYVTQKPWNRIPTYTKTLIYNPILGCLAGGRNKLVAAKAYDLLNSELEGSGLAIITPDTMHDVTKGEIPLLVEKLGGYAVIKIPYSNAGQGVFTITNKSELQDFMDTDHGYNQFIVQSLIGNSNWTSNGKNGKLYHIGTIPNKKKEIFVSDLRMMLISTPSGMKPVALYSRKAAVALKDSLDDGIASWEMLGTNLSIKKSEDQWDSDTHRLLIMDRKDFNTLGIGIDDLIDAYVQTVLGIVAIDKMALRLVNKDGKFRKKLFKSINNDPHLHEEIT